MAQVVQLLVYGPEPIGAADAAALEAEQIRLLAGGPGGGTPHWGERGDPEVSWAGWTASPQQFQGNIQMGKGTAVVETYPALPSTSAPSAIPSWLANYETLQAGSA